MSTKLHFYGTFRSLDRAGYTSDFTVASLRGLIFLHHDTQNRSRRRRPVQNRSRAFRIILHIYRAESIANCTKPHRFGPLTRPRTLLEQGAKWCISGTKIQGRVSISSFLAFQSTNSKSSKQVAFTFVSIFARCFSTYRDFRTPQGGNSCMLCTKSKKLSSFRPE